jgi:hypothetical protein
MPMRSACANIASADCALACGAERDGGLACKDRHEKEVDQVTALIRRNVQVGVKAQP